MLPLFAASDNCDTMNTCENGATCVSTTSSIQCLCLDGFEGDNCETG